MKRALVLLIVAVACKPDLGPSDSLVTSDRVLAVRGEPPEVSPGTAARFDVLVALPDGDGTADRTTWAVCTTPKPLGENDIVNQDCVSGGGAKAIGGGSPIEATIPGNACALFGPDPPPGGYRARDPDSTGGYYQPVRAQFPGADVAFALERVTCNLANASADVAREYATTYVPNVNPKLLPLTADVDLGSVHASSHVALEAAWTPDSAESYVAFDPTSQAIVPRRESMRVSWFATDGRFDQDRTGRDESDTATTSDDGWAAPDAPGNIHLWIVLRDSRGGVDFASYDVRIVP
jgi:hypothetical protein